MQSVLTCPGCVGHRLLASYMLVIIRVMLQQVPAGIEGRIEGQELVKVAQLHIQGIALHWRLLCLKLYGVGSHRKFGYCS